jgi:phage FluMu protein Com
MQALARQIVRVYRRIAAPVSGVHTLTPEERRAIRDQIIEGMALDGVKLTPELKAIAALLAGLRDELPVGTSSKVQKSAGAFEAVEARCPHCSSVNNVEITGVGKLEGLQDIRCSHCSKAWKEDLHLAKRATGTTSPELRQLMNDTREKLEVLRGRITKMLDDRVAASNARSGTLDKDAVAQRELRKALANGKPAHFDGEGINKSSFQPVESVTPGVQMPSGTLPVAAEVRKRAKFQPLAESE